MKDISQAFFNYYVQSINSSNNTTTYISLDEDFESRTEIDILEDTNYEAYTKLMNRGISSFYSVSIYLNLLKKDRSYVTFNKAYHSSQEAISSFREATILCSDSISAWNNYGFSLAYNENFSRGTSRDFKIACACFEKCLDLDITYENARKNLDSLLDKQSLLRRSLVEKPNSDGEKEIENGMEKFRAERYEESILSFQEALRCNPNAGRALKYKGYAHYEISEYRAAIRCFKKYLSKHSEDVICKMALIKSLNQYGEYFKALKELEKFNLSISSLENHDGLVVFLLSEYLYSFMSSNMICESSDIIELKLYIELFLDLISYRFTSIKLVIKLTNLYIKLFLDLIYCRKEEVSEEVLSKSEDIQILNPWDLLLNSGKVLIKFKAQVLEDRFEFLVNLALCFIKILNLFDDQKEDKSTGFKFLVDLASSLIKNPNIFDNQKEDKSASHENKKKLEIKLEIITTISMIVTEIRTELNCKKNLTRSIDQKYFDQWVVIDNASSTWEKEGKTIFSNLLETTPSRKKQFRLLLKFSHFAYLSQVLQD